MLTKLKSATRKELRDIINAMVSDGEIARDAIQDARAFVVALQTAGLYAEPTPDEMDTFDRLTDV